MNEQAVTISIDLREPIPGTLTARRDEEQIWRLGTDQIIAPPRAQVSVERWPHPFEATQEPVTFPVAVFVDDHLTLSGRAVLIDWSRGSAVLELTGEVVEH